MGLILTLIPEQIIRKSDVPLSDSDSKRLI
jgi:hypothetical protein